MNNLETSQADLPNKDVIASLVDINDVPGQLREKQFRPLTCAFVAKLPQETRTKPETKVSFKSNYEIKNGKFPAEEFIKKLAVDTKSEGIKLKPYPVLLAIKKASDLIRTDHQIKPDVASKILKTFLLESLENQDLDPSTSIDDIFSRYFKFNENTSQTDRELSLTSTDPAVPFEGTDFNLFGYLSEVSKRTGHELNKTKLITDFMQERERVMDQYAGDPKAQFQSIGQILESIFENQGIDLQSQGLLDKSVILEYVKEQYVLKLEGFNFKASELIDDVKHIIESEGKPFDEEMFYNALQVFYDWAIPNYKNSPTYSPESKVDQQIDLIENILGRFLHKQDVRSGGQVLERFDNPYFIGRYIEYTGTPMPTETPNLEIDEAFNQMRQSGDMLKFMAVHKNFFIQIEDYTWEDQVKLMQKSIPGILSEKYGRDFELPDQEDEYIRVA